MASMSAVGGGDRVTGVEMIGTGAETGRMMRVMRREKCMIFSYTCINF